MNCCHSGAACEDPVAVNTQKRYHRRDKDEQLPAHSQNKTSTTILQLIQSLSDGLGAFLKVTFVSETTWSVTNLDRGLLEESCHHIQARPYNEKQSTIQRYAHNFKHLVSQMAR
jgi:hypothetical protein